MNSQKQRVLIVDDEPRNQRIATEILEDLCECKCVGSGEEALSALDDFKPDLVLLDIMMAGINGYDVCRKIRENANHPFLKIILVSGKAMVEERLQGYAAGADDYMTKPFVAEELLAKSKVFLRLTKAERQILQTNISLEGQVVTQKAEIDDTKAKMIDSAKMAALGEMAGGIAHEINTPLSTIRLLVDFLSDALEDEVLDRDFINEKIQTIEKTVQRISNIVGGLRTFSRNGGSDQFESVPVRRIVEDTLSLCGEKLKFNSIKVEVVPIDDSVKAQCRAVQISQVLLNLVSNACDAIMDLPEKWIRIDVKSAGGRIAISVIDSGCGIPDSVREKLFQPFFTTKEIGRGTGLGLSISKGIVESHQGRLELDTFEGHTRFIIDIPVIQNTTSSDKGKAA